MTAVTRPRGPLPARVYWTRRLLLVVLALALVLGVARLLGGGSGGGGASAAPVDAQETALPTSQPTSTPSATATDLTTATATATVPPTGPTGPSGAATPSGRASRGATQGPTALAAPSGECPSSDVVAVPAVASPSYAGRPVILTLNLTTKVTPACTWVVSPTSLVVKVSRGDQRIWSTQDCVGAVPKQSVVVRQGSSTPVAVAWNGLRSDAECSRSTSWAQSGPYEVVAAAFGSEPTQEAFRLVDPPRAVVTRAPRPSATASPSGTASPSATASPRSR